MQLLFVFVVGDGVIRTLSGCLVGGWLRALLDLRFVIANDGSVVGALRNAEQRNEQHDPRSDHRYFPQRFGNAELAGEFE